MADRPGRLADALSSIAPDDNETASPQTHYATFTDSSRDQVGAVQSRVLRRSVGPEQPSAAGRRSRQCPASTRPQAAGVPCAVPT